MPLPEEEIQPAAGAVTAKEENSTAGAVPEEEIGARTDLACECQIASLTSPPIMLK